MREAPVVSPDETGWKVGGELQWLWVFATPDLTVYAIQDGRGFEQATRVLGPDYDGVLIRDGWAPYRRFEEARHQSCVAHNADLRIMPILGRKSLTRAVTAGMGSA